MKIAIQAPPYHSASGGIRVLHYLGYLAYRLGHQVDMRSCVLNPEWGRYSAFHGNDPDITILPEISPASEPGRNTVRWVLFFPARLAGPAFYPEHELVVSFHPAYTEATCHAAPGRKVTEFFLPVCDLPGFDETPQRDLPGVVWVGKGEKQNIPDIAGLPEITRGWPSPRKELIRYLKRCKRFFSFDQWTALNSEAQICGCEVFVWDGSSFKPFFDPDAYELIPNEERQLLRVQVFLRMIAEHFGVVS